MRTSTFLCARADCCLVWATGDVPGEPTYARATGSAHLKDAHFWRTRGKRNAVECAPD